MTDNENKPAAAPSWCGVCGKPMEQVSGWCDKPGICPHGQIAQLRKAREATEKPKASAVPESQGWGFAMVHKTGTDRGFSWNADDPNFSDNWTRVPLMPAAPQAEKEPAGISIQDLVAERRKDPRKAVALDRVKEAHAAAPTSHVQPSIADDPEFRAMYLTCAGTLLWTEEGYRRNAAFVDAKLIKAKKAGYFEAIMDSIEKLRDLDLDKSE